MVKFKSLFLLVFLSLLSTFCLAKSISLHEQPKADSKTVGSIDSETGLIPIYTPQGSDWIKVGDPRNGDVGWIKLSDLNAANTTSNGVTVTEKTVTSGNVPHTIQIIQFGSPEKMSAQQAKMIKQMKEQQEALQRDLQKTMNDVFKNTSQQWSNFPMIIPVIVVPEQKPAAAAATAPAVKK